MENLMGHGKAITIKHFLKGAKMFGKIAFWHKRYSFGDDDHGIDYHKYRSFNEMAEKEFGENDVWRPIYMLDHSGLSFSTWPFNDPWDSGQVGFAFARGDEIKRYFKGIDKASKLKAEALLLDRVEELNKK